jgi:hypothetical protein
MPVPRILVRFRTSVGPLALVALALALEAGKRWC